MEKIKSALEIALEKTNNLEQELTAEEIQLEKRERVRPMLAKFYKEEIDAEGLWKILKEEEDQDLLNQTQLFLVESLGLKTSEEQFKRRKEGVLAIETLKEGGNSSFFEQVLNQLNTLQQQYNQELEEIQEQLKEMKEHNSGVQMRPVRTRDGRTVMQLGSDLDQEIKKQFSQRIAQLEELYNNRFKQIIDHLRQELS